MNYPIHLTAEAPKPKEDISNAVADEHSVLYSRDVKRLLKCENKNITEYTVRNGTKVICNYAFQDCTGLTEITIPESVTEIGSSAFAGCRDLKIVNFNATACTSVGSRSYPIFEGCENLATFNFGDNVTIIPDYLCNELTGLTSISIPNNVTSLGSHAFNECIELTEITIPNSVTSIGSSAFCGCSGLTGVTIPESVTEIGSSAFAGCPNLLSITIPNSVTLIDNHAFSYCTGLTEITLPNSVTTIGKWAFQNCTALTSVTIPESVTSIGQDAFEYCSGLTGTLTIPNRVRTIGDGAFSHCAGLTRVTIPNSVTSIGDGAFAYCAGLMSITIPESVTSIGENAFYGCTGLIEITVPNSVTSIDRYTFSDCTGLTSITIGNSVTEIGQGAFEGCTRLTKITIPESVTEIGKRAFEKCTVLTSVTIGEGVTNIGEGAFRGCKGLNQFEVAEGNGYYCAMDGVLFTKDMTTLIQFPVASSMSSYGIPESVTEIGRDAFGFCSGLTQITIPNSVTSIGSGAFYNCKGLTEVTIPNSVTSIGSSAFHGCKELTQIEVADDNKYYCANDGILYSKDMKTLVLFPPASPIPPYFDIPERVTEIGEWAFHNCIGLTGVTIGNSVISIGRGAFRNCKNLASVTIPNSVTSIGEGAFANCTGLTEVTIGKGLTRIGKDAFGEDAFYNCKGLTQFEVAEDNGYYCAVNGVLYSKEMTTLVQCPLSSPLLPSFDIPENVTKIDDRAFHNCSSLKEVTIPKSVASIGRGAFRDCVGLTRVTSLNPEPPTCNGFVFYDVSTRVCTIYVPEGSAEAYSYAGEWGFFKNIVELDINNENTSTEESKEDLSGDDCEDISTNKTTYVEPTECETLVVSETDDLYANDIADKLGVDRVDYDIPSETRDEIDWEYPVAKYPEHGCVVFPYRNRSIARMGYMEPLFLDYLLETFGGCGLQIVGDCSILPRDGQRPYEPDIAIIPDEYPSIRIDVEIDEPYAAVTNKPIHYIGCGDDFRDMNLNNLGWIVIRFTEYQVHSDMKGCAAFIAQVLHDIQPRMSLPAYLLSYPSPETVERWQEIEAKVLATEKYREKYLKHKFTESEKREYTTADVTQTELEKECAELVSPLIVSPTSETTDEAIVRGDITTRQEHTDKCQQTQHDPVAIGTNHKDAVFAPSAVLPVAIEKRDERIQFFPFEHIYLYNGCAKLTPVSSVIACFFEQFDAVTQAEAKAYKGMPAGKILEDWDIKGCMAKEAGTFMHKQIENVYNGLEYQKVYHFRYDGKYLHADMEIPLEREYHHFKNFKRDHDFRPHKTEWAIYDENLEIAGTIDMLHKRGDVFDIYDWKRSNKIVDEEGEPVKIGFRGKSGINGLESVQDTAYWHYCIQQNLYRYILEKNYGITVGKMYLVVMIATMDNYIKLEVPRMGKAIDVIVEKCRNGFIKWMNLGLPF